MSETEERIEEAKRVVARLERYERALMNIAFGYWNAGRDKPITAEEYATQALADTLRPRP